MPKFKTIKFLAIIIAVLIIALFGYPINKSVSETTTDFVAAYNFDEGSGQNVLDVSGNGHNAVRGNNLSSESIISEYDFWIKKTLSA